MVEIIPKPAERTPLWQDLMLYFSLAVLVGTIGAYFLCGYFVNNGQLAIREKEKILDGLKTDERQELEQKAIQYKTKISDFALLANKHIAISNFFDFLEKETHPKVWFSGIELDVQKGTAKLSGESEKTALSQQLDIFRKNNLISNTDLTCLQVKQGEVVDFSISLSISSQTFKFFK